MKQKIEVLEVNEVPMVVNERYRSKVYDISIRIDGAHHFALVAVDAFNSSTRTVEMNPRPESYNQQYVIVEKVAMEEFEKGLQDGQARNN